MDELRISQEAGQPMYVDRDEQDILEAARCVKNGTVGVAYVNGLVIMKQETYGKDRGKEAEQ